MDDAVVADIWPRLTARQHVIILMPPEQRRQEATEEEINEIRDMIFQAQKSRIEDQDNHDSDDNDDNVAPPHRLPQLAGPEPFEYQPLSNPTSSLRLVRILPGAADSSGMLQVEMDEYDLDHHIPRYYCLSYCWGNPHAKGRTFDYHADHASEYQADDSTADAALVPIACNGRVLHVRRNLHDALRHLPADPFLFSKTRTVFDGGWVYFGDLHFVSAGGDVSATRRLLQAGAPVDAPDSRGRTPLMLATIKNHISVVRVLLEHGASADLRDHDRMSCLDHAVRHGRDEIQAEIKTFDPNGMKGTTSKRQRQQRSRNSTRLWIDAMCINQHDDHEKSIQVAAMDRIFKQAALCAVWLGPDDGTAPHAVRALTKLYPAARRGLLACSSICPFRGPTAQSRAYAAAGIEPLDLAEWTGLAALYLRQNFRRMWCLQEMVLQPRVAAFMGGYSIPWDELTTVTDQLHVLQRRYASPPSDLFRLGVPVEAEAYLVFELRHRAEIDVLSAANAALSGTPGGSRTKGTRFSRGEGRKASLPLLEMILQTTTLQCFDPRDHVYALLGMCGDHPESPTIVVDYSRPCSQLYVDIMWHLLCDEKLGRSLRWVAATTDSAAAERRSGGGNLPSWVLHFDLPRGAPFWRDQFHAAGEHSSSSSTRFDWQRGACGGVQELAILGKRIDTVEKLASDRSGREGHQFDFSWPSLLLSLPQVYAHTGQSRTEAMWRTLCTDAGDRDREVAWSRSLLSAAPDAYAGQFRDLLCAMLLARAEQSAFCDESRPAAGVRGSSGGSGNSVSSIGDDDDDDDDDGDDDGGGGGGGGWVQAILQHGRRLLWPFPTLLLDSNSSGGLRTMQNTLLNGLDPVEAELCRQALRNMEDVWQSDSECSLPSLAQIASFFDDPLYRCWILPDEATDVLEVRGVRLRYENEADISGPSPAGGMGFREQYLHYNRGRRLFVTEGKKYMGLGPVSAEVGDEVWVVKGSRVPFLLRPVRGRECDGEEEEEEEEERPRKRYRYMGDLYVHGMMRGEAVGASQEAWETVVLI